MSRISMSKSRANSVAAAARLGESFDVANSLFSKIDEDDVGSHGVASVPTKGSGQS